MSEVLYTLYCTPIKYCSHGHFSCLYLLYIHCMDERIALSVSSIFVTQVNAVVQWIMNSKRSIWSVQLWIFLCKVLSVLFKNSFRVCLFGYILLNTTDTRASPCKRLEILRLSPDFTCLTIFPIQPWISYENSLHSVSWYILPDFFTWDLPFCEEPSLNHVLEANLVNIPDIKGMLVLA